MSENLSGDSQNHVSQPKGKLPPLSELTIEESQLVICRWSFLILGAGLFLQIMIFFIRDATVSGEETVLAGNLLLESVMGAVILLTYLPGAAFLLKVSRSSRWRISAIWLALGTVLDVTLLALLLMLREPNPSVNIPQPLAILLLEQASLLVVWWELWWMVVLIAEFCLACRALGLVERCEWLGYTILGGLAANLCLAGWSMPKPVPMSNPDSVTILLQVAVVIVLFVAILWTLYLLASVSTLARLLVVRSEDCRSKLSNDREESI